MSRSEPGREERLEAGPSPRRWAGGQCPATPQVDRLVLRRRACQAAPTLNAGLDSPEVLAPVRRWLAEQGIDRVSCRVRPERGLGLRPGDRESER